MNTHTVIIFKFLKTAFECLKLKKIYGLAILSRNIENVLNTFFMSVLVNDRIK